MGAQLLAETHPRDDAEPAVRQRLGGDGAALRLSLLGAVFGLGLLVVALADGAARSGRLPESYVLLWVGLGLIFVPALAHAWGEHDRREMVTGLVLMGIALYLVKVLNSPLHLTDHDEFSTLRTALDIQHAGRPFQHNPLITVHPYFPGLELVTDALSSLTGMSLFASALSVIGLMRVAMMLALFLLFEAAGSPRMAALAAVLYAANPNFVFFNAQWAYESFSLPLALATVALVARAPWATWEAPYQPASGRQMLGRLAVPFLIALTVLVSHPLTSYALIMFLLAWAIIDTVMSRRGRRPVRRELWWLVGGVVGVGLIWTATIGGATGGYFGPVLSKAAASALDLVAGQSGVKRLFTAPGVPATPLAEKLVALASVGLALALLAAGCWRLRRQLTPLRLTLAVTAVLYIPSLPLRLTEAGTEISNRASEFVYVGIAYLAALLLTSPSTLRLPRSLRRRPRLRPRRGLRLPSRLHPSQATSASALRLSVVLVLGAVLFAGGIVVGWARYLRVPGPYLVVADERSVEPEGIAAARWSAEHLPRHARILADRANGLLVGSIGELDSQGGTILGRSVPELLLAGEWEPDDYYVLRADRLRYVLTDRRLTTGLPLVGVYVERDEPGAYDHLRPIPLSASEKFDGNCPISRIFDSGNIQIYDTSRLSLAGCPQGSSGAPHYERYSAAVVIINGRRVVERRTVELFDRLLQDPERNAVQLASLRVDLRALRRLIRLKALATPVGGWRFRWRSWRWQAIDNRLLGS